MRKFIVESKFVRRLPDPVFGNGTDRHILMVAVEDVPIGLPTEPNPRAPNVEKSIWRDIRKHLLNEDGTPNTFHLKNKGITLIASKVEKLSEEKWEISFDEDDGIVDGGHTYRLICDCMGDLAKLNDGNAAPAKQFVKIEILTGIDRELAIEIAGGLNTAIQVQTYSLENLRDRFKWIKDKVAGKPWVDDISFYENDDGKMDVRDILVILDLFNVKSFPNDGMVHPVRAYMSKAQVLDYYLAHDHEYTILHPILDDILWLYDTVQMEARDKHNEQGGKAGSLAFVENSARKPYRFPFVGKESEWRLSRAALLPMLAAFRWMVKINPETQLAEWDGGFATVRRVWDASGGELMGVTQETSDDNKRKVHAIGRAKNHWKTLHSVVAKKHLMMKHL
jgi:hypothetical protein